VFCHRAKLPDQYCVFNPKNFQRLTIILCQFSITKVSILSTIRLSPLFKNVLEHLNLSSSQSKVEECLIFWHRADSTMLHNGEGPACQFLTHVIVVKADMTLWCTENKDELTVCMV
jgi:hypothetical protein